MSLPRSVAEVLKQHVTLEVEGIDRMYLNVYQPRLQTDRGVAAFFRYHRGYTFASSALMDPISKAFITAVERLVVEEQIPLITFAKGQRKDDIAKEYHSRFQGTEGVVFVGKAQEKTPVFRTEKRRNPQTGQTYLRVVAIIDSDLSKIIATGFRYRGIVPFPFRDGERNDSPLIVNASVASHEACGRPVQLAPTTPLPCLIAHC